ncbi:MAG: carbohydrate ABC transporter permease [Candidatus Nanopelagicaceae bacterium]|jgi:multiple sugar transport system permease protein|nr:carbohydrate ABC transporter permease [Candidatus Nanopelagicaceae bacterium]
MSGIVQNQKYRNRQKRKDAFISLFIGIFAFLWMVPILWTFWTSLRPYQDIIEKGVFSRPDTLNLNNYVEAYRQMEIWGYLKNSFIVAIPAVGLTLFFGSLLAFVVTRYSFRFNLYLLLLFTAGNLLPVQLVYAPLFKMYIWFGDLVGNRNILYDSYLGLILVHVALQVGFATFVMSSYMKTIPKEISESALVDGASVFRHYWSVILPLLRPPLAALSVLMTTWIYNEFFWAIVMIKSDNKRPITSALGRLQGEYVTDFNLLAAGAIMAALPTLIIFFILKRQFVSGLTLGSTKG